LLATLVTIGEIAPRVGLGREGTRPFEPLPSTSKRSPVNTTDAPARLPIQAVATHPAFRALAALLLLFLFLLGVNGLGEGFKSLGQGLLNSFFTLTENPFMGLMVGILATSLVQSSSVTTSLIVGLVAASDNALPLANAVPMVMGANIGTTVTNALVSFAHMGRKEEFRRAFAVAMCHDFFNVLAVAIFLPLEMMTGYLRHSAMVISSFVTGFGGMEYESPIKELLKAGLTPIKAGIDSLTSSPQVAGTLLIIVSAAFIFLALMLLVRLLRQIMHSRVERIVSRGLHQSAVVAILVGMVVTTMVQSSSITTSLLVPLAGAGLLTLPQAFPITIGANIGTTITALLAALGGTGPNARFGIAIAVVHLLFNLGGTLLIYPIERIRNIPLAAARKLADASVESRRRALIFVISLFYGVPALFAGLNKLFG
jgi:sodium-dependent phosphate cotransporter